jgi:hypothetical protein
VSLSLKPSWVVAQAIKRLPPKAIIKASYVRKGRILFNQIFGTDNISEFTTLMTPTGSERFQLLDRDGIVFFRGEADDTLFCYYGPVEKENPTPGLPEWGEEAP